MKNFVMALSIFCLAISIIIGSWIISKGLNNQEPNAVTVQTNNQNHHLLTQQQIADYLGLSTEEVGKLMSTQSKQIEDGIPYIKIDNKVYFDRIAVNKWIEDKQYLSVQ